MNTPEMQEAIKKVFEKFDAMSKAELQAMLDQHEKDHPRCNPDDCGGSCQGMGWCYTCEDFRGEAPDDHMEELLG